MTMWGIGNGAMGTECSGSLSPVPRSRLEELTALFVQWPLL